MPGAAATKGMLAAGGGAAAMVVGVALCIMGTFSRKSWKQRRRGWSNHDTNDGMGRGRYRSNKPCDIITMDTPGCNMQTQSVQSNTAWEGGEI